MKLAVGSKIKGVIFENSKGELFNISLDDNGDITDIKVASELKAEVPVVTNKETSHLEEMSLMRRMMNTMKPIVDAKLKLINEMKAIKEEDEKSVPEEGDCPETKEVNEDNETKNKEIND